MTRGCGHRDEPLIAERRASGVYEDQRSYVSTDGREYLFGHDIRNRRWDVWERDQRRCVSCSMLLALNQMHMDHKKARSAGGDDRTENLQTMCPRCHVQGPNAKHA